MNGVNLTNIYFSPDDEQKFKNFALSGNVFQKLSTSVAPYIIGHTEVKKVITCLLFEGCEKAVSYTHLTLPTKA